MKFSQKLSWTIHLRKVLVVLSLTYASGASTAEDPQPAATTPSITTEETAIDEAAVENAAADHFLLQQQNLAAELKPDELIWLDVTYPEASESVQTLALVREPRTPQAHGAVLILHDKEQHPDWPHIIRPLRLGLPDAGWYTLSMSLPYENTAHSPKRDLPSKHSESMELTDQLKASLAKAAERKKPTGNTDTQTDEAADTSITKEDLSSEKTDSADNSVDINLSDQSTKETKAIPYDDRALAHVKSALDYIASAGYQNVIIITYRGSANIALKHIKPFAPAMTNQGFALVMINPILDSEFQYDISKAIGKNFQAPVLDIVDSSNIGYTQQASERLITARASNVANYHQAKFAIVEGSRQRTLLKRIHYWLETYAPGMAATKISQN